MIAWFAYSVWQLRDVWAQVYALHDAKRSEAERIQSAQTLSRDPRVSDRQLMEICLQPRPARSSPIPAGRGRFDRRRRARPSAYALTVALSPDWPDWLRLVLSRRLAYGATRGYAIPEVALDELAKNSDPMIRLWANYSLAVMPGLKTDAAAKLEEAARSDRRERQARADACWRRRTHSPEERERRLDEATLWLRHHHPAGGEDLAAITEAQRPVFTGSD